jgi:hypothetical protein
MLAMIGRGSREPALPARRPARMSMRPRFLRLVVLAAVAVLVSACQALPVGSTIPDQGGPLVSVVSRGGECPDGACGSATVIARDGQVHQIEPVPADLGEVPPAILTALDAAIKTTDFEAIRAVAFTGECPVNFDGQEVIYEFAAPSGVERIASCETEVDPDHPLFAAVDAALAAVATNPAGG